MVGFVKHTLKFESKTIFANEVFSCEANKVTSFSIKVLGDTKVRINDMEIGKDDGIFAISLEAPNMLAGDISIIFLDAIDRKAVIHTLRLIDSSYNEVKKVCK
jgi:hypothetical protein